MSDNRFEIESTGKPLGLVNNGGRDAACCDRRTFMKACSVAAGSAFIGNPVEGTARAAGNASQPSHLVRFGSTDLHVSRYCQGTAFRHTPRNDNPQARRILQKCLDVGINFFDSAEAYGLGGSEEVLGKVMAGHRDQVILCTKAWPFSSPPPKKGIKGEEKAVFTRDTLFRKAEGSLKRLGTNYIDLFLLHSPDYVTPPEEIVDSMDALVRSGKIRYWGVSNFKPDQVEKFYEISQANKKKAPIVGIEDVYNIVWREGLEPDKFKLLQRTGLGLMAYSPQNTGRLSPGRSKEEELKVVGKTQMPVVRALDQVARNLGATRSQVCIAWVLSHPEVTSVLGGAESPAHVVDNFGGTRLKLPPEAIATLNAASDKYMVYRNRQLKEEQERKKKG